MMTYHPDCLAHCSEPEICLGSMDGPETWKPDPDYPGYLVSDRGRYLSTDRPDLRGRWRAGRILRQTMDPRGYRRIDVRRDGKRYPVRVHVGVLRAFVGPRPEGMQACHGDGNRGNNCPENLRWDTPASNIRDSVVHGTHPNARKRTCKRGHALTGENLVPSALKRGHRSCRACNRARAYVARHPDADLRTVSDRYYRKITGTVEDAA